MVIEHYGHFLSKQKMNFEHSTTKFDQKIKQGPRSQRRYYETLAQFLKRGQAPSITHAKQATRG